MPNDLFRQFNSGNGFQNPAPQSYIKSLFQNPLRFFREFNQFRSTIQNDPQQMVNQLLQSGQMSQSLYSELGQYASEIQKFFPK